MQKIFKNGKQILAFVFAVVIMAASLFVGSFNITADACDLDKIDYWDGTLASKFASGTGKADDPYIIETAEQLAFCCLGQTPSSTNASSGKYYKVSDNVKTFVMQPENVVNLDELLALTNPDEVNAYFEGLEGKINWISKFNKQSFNGNFDGNGATIYGLYATTDGTTAEDVALFPQYDGGHKEGVKKYYNTCKNIALKNSWLYSKRRLGGIVGACYLTNYGAKFDGKVTIDSCVVENCYMTAIGGAGGWNYFQEQGVVACGGTKDIVILDKVLVKNVYAYNTEMKANINIIGNGGDTTKSSQYQNTVTDSIFLGTAPYGMDYYVNTLHQPYEYTNVVTDFPTGPISLATPTWDSEATQQDYTDHIYSVTSTGAEFKAEASMLDWKNTWFMGAKGPELRVFHSNLKLTTTYTTHVWNCDCCGAQSVGGVTEHNFVLVGDTVAGDGSDVYMCSECDYVCQHNEQTAPEYNAGDCVTPSGVYTECEFCDWYFVADVGGIPGHKLTYTESDIGDCETLGHKEYWECSVCNNKFTSDDTMAPMSSAVSDADLSTGYGPHTKECDDQGKEIILYDENGHWYKCSVNGGRLDFDSNDLGETGVVKHVFKNSVCVDCGYKCVKHSYKLTGKYEQTHSCTTDEVSELQCEFCKHKTTLLTKPASHTIEKVEKVLPNDRTEGTKEHYKCKECLEIYVDAEGTTKADTAALVIPKVLSDEYLKQVNADPGTTSPSTGDSFASMFALAAFAGVALVMSRKVK